MAHDTGLVHPRNVPVEASPLSTVAPGDKLPGHCDTEVPVDTLLRIGFDAPPVLGQRGTIQIHRAEDGAVVDAIELADPFAIYDGSARKLTTNLSSSKVNVIGGLRTGIDRVRVVNYVPVMTSDNTAVIFPHNNRLAYGTTYYVTIDDGVLSGTIGGADFHGLDPGVWFFTTKAVRPASYAVADDNSADFATVQGAIDAVPPGNTSPVTIDIAPGVYQELLFIANKNNVTLRSDDSVATVIQYENCDGFNPGTGSAQTVTSPGPSGTLPPGDLEAGGRAVLLAGPADLLALDGITLMNTHVQNATTLRDGTPLNTGLTFINYVSAITQAETIYFNTGFNTTIPAGRLIARGSNFVSFQDTVQVKGWSWFYDCFITGDVDFIWGNANAAVFERSEIKSRFRTQIASVLQSRAYLGYGDTATPTSYNRSYPGFVILQSALTKEDGAFSAYLARSPGAAASTGGGTPPVYYYYNYDIIAVVSSMLDSHIDPLGWSTPGPNVAGTAVTGWREYGSVTPDGTLVDTSRRLSFTSTPPTTSGHSSIQLTSEDVATFFPDRETIFSGATNGVRSTIGYPGGWSPQP